MCGFTFLSGVNDTDEVREALNATAHRGPEASVTRWVGANVGSFHHLMINGVADGGQPICHRTWMLWCNGEIYNYRDLIRQHNLKPKTNSDCEVIILLYAKFFRRFRDPHATCVYITELLRGEFAFVISNTTRSWIHAARDGIGVRPLYMGRKGGSFGVASELKALNRLFPNAEQFPAGTVGTLCLDANHQRFTKFFNISRLVDPEGVKDPAFVNRALTEAVKDRMMSQRPVGALLSGGLDSSLVAALAAKNLGRDKLHTFSIGMKGSPDLKYAAIVANHIGSIHHKIELTEEDFLAAIDETIRVVESYDITTIRASVGNYLVAKWIRENTDVKVVLNGDYSDEVTGGYLYLKSAPSFREFHEECCRLVENVHYFDGLRSDRTISSQGLEARAPFSDANFIKSYMNCGTFRTSNDKQEKLLLRQAFAGTGLLPDEVLWRQKEAFSDGVSTSDNRSWFQVINEWVGERVSDEEFLCQKDGFQWLTPPTKEAYYYRKIFAEHYPNSAHVLPYFWMPKWSKTSDPSARTLTVYN
jgi:asparagine synthase (glutamine-hydrolysing)